MKKHKHKHNNSSQKDTIAAYIMLLPFLTFFSIFVLYPIIKNIIFSFTDFKFGQTYNFVWLDNYKALFKDKWFINSLVNTSIYSLFSVIFLTLLSLFLAVLLNRRARAVKIARTVLIFPYATSMIAVSMIWLFLLDPTVGFVNKVIMQLTNSSLPAWLHSPSLALPSLIFIGIWKNLGYIMIIYLGGLSAIPIELYEAATVDGAGAIKKFTKITLPQIAPVMFFVIITNCIEAFKTFEQVYVMTQGGPMTTTTTVVHQIYQRAFEDFRMGYAAAMSMFLFAIIFSITLVNFVLLKKRSESAFE